ncbi:11277_t:CDS:2, partial [Paraglomus occultum]
SFILSIGSLLGVERFTLSEFNEDQTVAIKPAHSNDLIDGYNLISWRDYGGYQSTTDSFLSDNIRVGKISRVENKKHAVVWHSDCRPELE